VSKFSVSGNLDAIARYRGVLWGKSVLISTSIVGIFSLFSLPTYATIPIEGDIPEEILRTEIITEARSPIDGQPLSPAEFAELVVQIQERNDKDAAQVVADNPKFKELFFLIKLRSFLRSVGIPIK
jgi:hypothetical protein